MRWRLFEAAVALVALLVSNQLAWLAWTNVSGRLRANSHRIWLLPTERNKKNDEYVRQKQQSGSSEATLNAADEVFNFTVFTSPRQKVGILCDSVKYSESLADDTGRFLGGVLLHRGRNIIEARTLPLNYFEDHAVVAFHPPNALPPNLLGVIPFNQYLTVVGYTEPDSDVMFELPDHRSTLIAPADHMGLFEFLYSLAPGVTCPVSAWVQPRDTYRRRLSCGCCGFSANARRADRVTGAH